MNKPAIKCGRCREIIVADPDTLEKAAQWMYLEGAWYCPAHVDEALNELQFGQADPFAEPTVDDRTANERYENDRIARDAVRACSKLYCG